MSQKKLMILGAGPGQLSAIKKAVELGFYVYTVDYIPENIGHKYSHQFINCSTVDKEKVLIAAQNEKIDGIVTFASDIATPTVGYVSEQMGLPGVTELVAQTMSVKSNFRIAQKNSPKVDKLMAISSNNFDEIMTKISDLKFPVMFKPADTSGSRGITKVNSLSNVRECQDAFEFAQEYSRSKTVCVEEFLEGVEVGGDGFLIDGNLAFIAITHKHKLGFIPIGHSLPTNILLKQQEKVIAEINANCKAVNYWNGPLNFDVMVSENRVSVLEMSPRLGGNGIASIILRSTGVDLVTITLNFAAGNQINILRQKENNKLCGSWVIGSEKSGILRKIASDSELRKSVPEVFEYFVIPTPGDKVSRFIHSGNNLGYVLFDIAPDDAYDQVVSRIKDALFLEVE